MREDLEEETQVSHLQFSDRHCEVSSLTGTENWRSLLYACSEVKASEKNVTCDHPAFCADAGLKQHTALYIA